MISRIIKFNRISVKKINGNRSAHNANTFKNLKTEREKRNFINEARNSKKSKTDISSLKNVFGDIYTDQNNIVNLLNYRFSSYRSCLSDNDIPCSSGPITMRERLKPIAHNNKYHELQLKWNELSQLIEPLNLFNPKWLLVLTNDSSTFCILCINNLSCDSNIWLNET